MKVKIVAEYFSEEMQQLELDARDEGDGIVTVECNGMEFCLLKDEYEIVT